jgi:hypothetical protein
LCYSLVSIDNGTLALFKVDEFWSYSIVVFLALSSCLGESFRAHFARSSDNEHIDGYDRFYLRGMTTSGFSMSEQIELDEMYREEIGIDSDHEE